MNSKKTFDLVYISILESNATANLPTSKPVGLVKVSEIEDTIATLPTVHKFIPINQSHLVIPLTPSTDLPAVARFARSPKLGSF